jgi:hypothetical protein
MSPAESNPRDAQNRERFALRRALAKMAAGERRLTRGLDALDERLDLVERDLDQQLRREHWGRDPERLPVWRSRRRGRACHRFGDVPANLVPTRILCRAGTLICDELR